MERTAAAQTRRAVETAEMSARPGTGMADRLHLVEQLRAEVAELEQLTVNDARADNWTWQDIGEVLGTSRQAAQQRFS
jgi:hypothetical protein